jgi:hypothetical protein
MRPREDFQQMTVGAVEIETAPAVAAIDFASASLARVSPILKPALANAAEDGIEVVFVDQESVVLKRNVSVDLIKIERRSVVERNDHKWAEAGRRGQAEDFREKRCGALLVAAPDDGVVEPNTHVALSPDNVQRAQYIADNRSMQFWFVS